MRTIALILLALTTTTAVAAEPQAGGYQLRDGDTVVFLGDSITAARTYGKIVENYTLLRFPERKIRFFNAGLGGDTAAGSLARLDRDVFAHQPTVVFVAFGTNDIGWGMKANDESKQKYLNAVREIIARSEKHGARVYLCSAAATAQDPDAAAEGFLQKMCDEGMQLARDLGHHAIDVQRAMREIQRKTITYSEKSKEQVKLHLADGAHLTELGQLAMAWAIIKGLGAPAAVSSAHVDAATGATVAAMNCKISEVKQADGGVSFTRLDDGLPFNGGLFYALNFRFVPMLADLGQYELRVGGLAAGRYTVTAEGIEIGTYTAKQLVDGINIASATGSAWKPGGPWAVQAVTVQCLTDARHELAKAEFLAQIYGNVGGAGDELAKDAPETDDRLIALQRQAAKPRPYRFEIRPAVAAVPSSKD
jgi:lysophospholipase L1-like esterase